MQSSPFHIVFAGGGTLGHLLPGITVAERLAERLPNVEISFAGTGHAQEQAHVTAAGFRYLAVPCRPAPKRPWDALRFVSDNMAGMFAARWFLREHRASLAVGLGGYASAPMLRAAIHRQLPAVLLEVNAVPGKVTRWLAPSATRVCIALDAARRHLKTTGNVCVTGTPLRRSFDTPRRATTAADGLAGRLHRKKIVVLGGSGGSPVLNQFVPRAFYKLGTRLGDWQIVHQTGAGSVEEIQTLYRKLGLQALVVSFIDNPADVLRAADLAVCRAGGSTLAELAATGTPAVVVPYAEAADNHQWENAQVFARRRACRTVAEHEPSGRIDDRLAHALEELVGNDHVRQSMAGQMATFSVPRASETVASIICELLNVGALPLAA